LLSALHSHQRGLQNANKQLWTNATLRALQGTSTVVDFTKNSPFQSVRIAEIQCTTSHIGHFWVGLPMHCYYTNKGTDKNKKRTYNNIQTKLREANLLSFTRKNCLYDFVQVWHSVQHRRSSTFSDSYWTDGVNQKYRKTKLYHNSTADSNLEITYSCDSYTTFV